jgi:hypothetical protein
MRGRLLCLGRRVLRDCKLVFIGYFTMFVYEFCTRGIRIGKVGDSLLFGVSITA